MSLMDPLPYHFLIIFLTQIEVEIYYSYFICHFRCFSPDCCVKREAPQAPGWHSRLSAQLLVSAQVVISG